MGSDLATYLQDHLAGANAAVEVIALLHKHSEEPVLTELLVWLASEVQEDRETLERLAIDVAAGPSTIKDSAAWIGARMVSLKIEARKSSFGAFEGLEFLCLGIQGKLHLWRALGRSPACSKAPNIPDFSLLIERAQAQHRRVEDLRLAIATITL